MKKIFFIISIFISFFTYAQTGIGTTTPDASAKLEVNATNKGFLPPRVALTATNSANPITNPANGLMVFNTATAGISPFQVVPGYYYWDGSGTKWVSLSTTVGNVQNQAIFRSTSNTSALQAITTWDSRFNNIASGDLTVNASTTFTLSNGIYKIEWALPYQSYNTYNTMQLQELSSGNWITFRNDGGYANLSNGGSTDWGGGTFAADILDCSSSSKTIRIINNDGASRTLFYGVTLIITKLNPSITTSTTADNLGDHTATKNILLNGNYLSNDGGNEGIRIDNTGKIGIGTSNPGTVLHIENGNTFGTDPSNTNSPSLLIYNNNNASSSANSSSMVRTAGTGSGKPYYGLDVFGFSGYSIGINNPTDQMILNTTWNFSTGTAGYNALIINRSGQTRIAIPDQNGAYSNDWPSGWGGSLSTYDICAASIKASNFVTRSDRRLKNNISNIDSISIAKFLKLRPVSFYWNQDQPRDPNLQYGLIAQEVELLFPELVNNGVDSIQTKSVNYQALHALSLKVIQAQQNEIEALKKKQAEFEERLLKIEVKLN